MTAAVAAIAALLGVLIGRYWDSRSELARWRRDLKTGSYQQFAEKYHLVYEGIRALALADRKKVDFGAVHERIRAEYLSEWETALSAIWLHGSAEVVQAAVAVDRASTDLFARAIQNQIDDWTQFEQERLPLRRSFEGFMQAARVELQLPEVQASFFWDTTRTEGAV